VEETRGERKIESRKEKKARDKKGKGKKSFFFQKKKKKKVVPDFWKIEKSGAMGKSNDGKK